MPPFSQISGLLAVRMSAWLVANRLGGVGRVVEYFEGAFHQAVNQGQAARMPIVSILKPERKHAWFGA